MLGNLLALFMGKGRKMVQVRKIDSGFDVAGQLVPDQMAEVSTLGYKRVICMRPDNEGFNQPAFADIAAAADKAGLTAIYFPVVPGQMTPDQARKLKTILGSESGPVLAFCASGNRCAAAYDMARRV
ncbi:TIGR01244 family sulfur transferase [Gellertiella hungarica]|uniref:Sulfide:quinone oxidoreductase n=1 Tax=Gellertiella hungarica TaxID=1572859 RepID=A0A7W6J7N5_9HYPH|nr:TIGR01244 family sulfur transferase [Gellertiella hungarica]MBB4065376.1 sulfide:quinone oxidoreductase [Gellertiella hungarica]